MPPLTDIQRDVLAAVNPPVPAKPRFDAAAFQRELTAIAAGLSDGSIKRTPPRIIAGEPLTPEQMAVWQQSMADAHGVNREPGSGL